MKKVLVTGVSGFIGRYVVRQFVQAGWQVAGLDALVPDQELGRIMSAFIQAALPSIDLKDFVHEIKPDVCVHCAGPSSVDFSMAHPDRDFAGSVAATFGLLDTLRLHSPECHLLFLSSAAVYGNPETLPIDETHRPNPISPYGFHKWMCEQLCAEFSRVYHLPTSIVRIFSAYGVGLKRQVLWDMCRRAFTQPVLRMRGTGSESRDFIHAWDVAKALLFLADETPSMADVYNLASGTETTIRELTALILATLGRALPVEFDGMTMPGNPLNWRADIRRIRRIGFSPEMTMEEGVTDYVRWCQGEVEGR